MRLGKRSARAVIGALVLTVGVAAFIELRPERDHDWVFSGAYGVYGVEDLGGGAAGFDVRDRDQVLWYVGVLNGGRDDKLEITDARVTPVPFLELEVALTRDVHSPRWPARPIRRMSVRGFESVAVLVRASGPGCPFGPAGTAFLAKSTLTVEYLRDGRRGTATRALDPVMVGVPMGATCSSV